MKWAAAAGVVVAALSGIVTNIVTESFTWTLAAVLTALVLLGAGLAWWSAAPAQRRSKVRVRYGPKSLADHADTRVTGGGTVRDTLRRKAQVHHSTIDNDGGDVHRKIKRGGVARNSNITVD